VSVISTQDKTTAGGADETCCAPASFIPRSQLVYRCIDFADVPAALRHRVLQQRLKSLVPFTEFDYFLVWESHQALVWLWPVAAGFDSSSRPEPLFHPSVSDGFQWLACAQGYELQYWQKGVLMQSSWSLEQPSDVQLEQFQRGCGALADPMTWLRQDLQWLPRSWAEKPFWTRENLISESVLAPTLAVFLSLWLIWVLGSGAGSYWRLSSLEDRVALQREQVQELLQLREAAMEQQASNQYLLELLDQSTQLDVAEELYGRLSAVPFRILDWQYQRGQLKLILQQPELDSRAVLEALAASQIFTQARIEPGLLQEQSVLTLTLSHQRTGGADE